MYKQRGGGVEAEINGRERIEGGYKHCFYILNKNISQIKWMGVTNKYKFRLQFLSSGKYVIFRHGNYLQAYTELH